MMIKPIEQDHFQIINIENMLLFALLSFLASASIVDPNLFQLGSNLVKNYNFMEPVVTGEYLYTSLLQDWNCIPKCQIVNTAKRCFNKGNTCSVGFQQAIDMDPTNLNSNMTQDILITTEGQYLLRITYMPPANTIIGKAVNISINGTQIAILTSNDDQYVDHVFEILVNGTIGLAVLQFQKGGIIDSYGVQVGIVQFRRLIPITSVSSLLGPFSHISFPLFDNFTKMVNRYPGNRIFIETLTDFLLTFDRLQFYFYHKQNLTHNSYVLLANVNTLAIERGSMTQRFLESCDASICTSITGIYDGILQNIEYKKKYTDIESLDKNPQGLGFFANNLQFFYYELPVIFLTYLLFSLAFKLLFNFRVSKYIRKYSFYGILLYIISEGNIEQFAFYFFTECKNLFSANFSHKIANILMIYFFFVIVVFSVGGLLFFFLHYKKLVKYFMEDSKVYTLTAIVLESFERSIFPLVFGALHAILIDNLLVQTIVLFLVECGYLGLKVAALKSKTSRYKFKVVLCAISSMLRLCFIVTFFVYEKAGLPFIINMIHYDIVCFYIVCWLVELIHDSFTFLLDVKEAIGDTITGRCRYEKKKLESDKLKTKKKSKSKSKKKNKSKNKTPNKTTKQVKVSSKSKEKEELTDLKNQRRSKGQKRRKEESGLKNKVKFQDKAQRNEEISGQKKPKQVILQTRNIVIKDKKDIPKIPNMIINCLKEDGLIEQTVGRKEESGLKKSKKKEEPTDLKEQRSSKGQGRRKQESGLKNKVKFQDKSQLNEEISGQKKPKQVKLQTRNIVIKDKKDIPKIPNMIINCLKEDGLIEQTIPKRRRRNISRD